MLVFLSCSTLALSQSTAPATAPAVAMAVSPAGDLALTLGGKVVAGGHWQIVHFPFQNIDPDEAPIGAMASTTVAADSPGHAVVTDIYPAAKITTDISLEGEDLRLATHIENQDKTKSLKKINFVGVDFHFAKPANGTLASWHWSYLAAKGLSIFHPSLAEPIGGVYARDDQLGFAAHSDSEFGRQTLFNAEFEKDGIIPANCRLQFFTTRVVPPGQAIDVDVSFRISADTSMAHLLGGYKKTYDRHFPALLYHPDNRPVAAFTGVGDQKTVTKANPYGIHRRGSALGFGGGNRRVCSADCAAAAAGRRAGDYFLVARWLRSADVSAGF